MQVIDAPKANRQVIVLMTGYEVDTSDEDWVEHLELALIGEMFLRTEGDWDDRMRFLVAELARVCDTYGLSPFAWFRSVVGRLDGYIEEALGE